MLTLAGIAAISCRSRDDPTAVLDFQRKAFACWPAQRIQQTLEALDIFRAVAGLPIIPITEMLHQTTFWTVRVPMLHNCPNFSSQSSRGTGRWQTQGRRGGAMRESLRNKIPDTAPYTEWLAIVGSIVAAVLVCAVLFSNGILT
jgi:hypothetical protein